MHQRYSFDWGPHLAIDDATKLCASRYGHWAAIRESTATTVS
jgi:hypothetical protein